MEKHTKTVLEIITIIGLLIGSYFVGKNSSSTPAKVQMVAPAPDTTGRGI